MYLIGGYKELTTKKQNHHHHQVTKWAENPKRFSQRRHTNGLWAHKKVLNTTNHQTNANQSPNTSHFTLRKNRVGEDVEKREPEPLRPYTDGGV